MSHYDELGDENQSNEQAEELRVDTNQANEDVHLPNFDSTNGLRGLCSLMIAFGHFLDFYTPNIRDEEPIKDAKLFPSPPYLLPVTMFFVLSGILYGYLYHDKWDDDRSCCCGCNGCSANFRKFICKRVLRLMPMVIFGVIMDLGYYWTSSGQWGWYEKFVATIGTVGLWSSATMSLGPDGPTWQISAMFLSYLLIPMLINHFKPMNNSSLNSQFWIFSAVGGFVLVLIFAGIPFIFIHILWYTRVWQFIAGVVLGVYMKKNAAPVSPLLTDIFTGLWALYFCSFPVSINLDWALEFALTPLLAVYVYHLCLLPSDSGITNRIFSTSVFQFLGDISFSLYVLHWGFFANCTFLLHQKYLDKISLDKDGNLCEKGDEDCTNVDKLYGINLIHALWIFPALILTSWIAKKVIEEPCRKQGERIFLG